MIILLQCLSRRLDSQGGRCGPCRSSRFVDSGGELRCPPPLRMVGSAARTRLLSGLLAGAFQRLARVCGQGKQTPFDAARPHRARTRQVELTIERERPASPPDPPLLSTPPTHPPCCSTSVPRSLPSPPSSGSPSALRVAPSRSRLALCTRTCLTSARMRAITA